eukprot:m.154957 g.154957  ORF g.154957 m.154957 type:complete len:428 (+) comp14391_c0_seq3:476-1759(+)
MGIARPTDGSVSPNIINLVYFLKFCGMGALNTGFVVLYLSQAKHLSLYQLGVISMLRPACMFLGAPVWTSIADQYRLHSAVYTVTTVIAAMARTCFLITPTYFAVMVVMILAEVVGAGSIPTLDAAVLATMANPADWGKHRLWGAVGYGLAVLAVGVLIDQHGYDTMFVAHVTLIATAVLLVRSRLKMGAKAKRDSDSDPETLRPRLTLDVLRSIVCSSTERTVFFLVVFLCGVGSGVIENFLFLYLRDEFGASNGLIGLGRTVTCASEVPMFWYAPVLIRRLGTNGVLSFACVCYVVRFGAYSVLQDPRLYLLVEPLHGVTYAVMWNASTAYAFELAPPGLGTTAQGLLSGIHMGLGQGIGALVGGTLYASFGARTMFQLLTVCPLLSLALVLASHFHKSAQPTTVSADGELLLDSNSEPAEVSTA